MLESEQKVAFTDITEEDIDKIVGQAMMEISGLLKPLEKMGQKDYVKGALFELQSLLRQVAWKVAGLDEPLGGFKAYHTNRGESGWWEI